MMMQSTLNSSLVLLMMLIAVMTSSTAVAEFTGLRNFEQSLSVGFGTCTTDQNCADQFPQCANSKFGCFCKKEVGKCDSDGECVIINPAMYKIYRTVCGCNGVLYGSESEATSNGVNVECYGNNCPCPADAPSFAPSPESSSDVAAVE
jgi:hypothetical protein